jgi:hypothetical protein
MAGHGRIYHWVTNLPYGVAEISAEKEQFVQKQTVCFDIVESEDNFPMTFTIERYRHGYIYLSLLN